MNVHDSIIHTNPKVETTQVGQMNQMWYRKTKEYYAATKRDVVLQKVPHGQTL
jgi:hypothetical protein